MIRKMSWWMRATAFAAMLFASACTKTCVARQADEPSSDFPVMSGVGDDWDAPPPGPRDDNPPPQAQGRHHDAQGEERMMPPPGNKMRGRPDAAGPDGRKGPRRPLDEANAKGPPRGPDDMAEGPGGRDQDDFFPLPLGPRAGDLAPPGFGGPPGVLGGHPLGRMHGPFFGGGMVFPNEQDSEMMELVKKEMKLEMKANTLVEEYRQAEGEKKEKIKEELRQTVAKQFELRQERRRLELKRLEEGLKRMKDVIERREKAREQILDRHLKELLNEEDELRF